MVVPRTPLLAARLAVCLGFGLAACLAPLPRAMAQPAGTGGVPVTAEPARAADVPVLLRGLGTVQGLNTVLVRARVDGTLDRVNFTEGQEVRAGDVLAEIDPRPYQAALDQARAKKAADEAQLANARLDLQRYSSLARSDFASRQSVDTQKASVDQTVAQIAGDDAAIATAALNLEFCRITSPIAGRVGLRLVDPGNLVHASDVQGIVTVAQVTPIAVLFTLPQESLPRVFASMGQGTLHAFAFAPDDRAPLGEGTLLTPDNAIDSGTGTIRLKAIFPNADRRLWPGQFVNARLEVGMLRGAVTVPSAAIGHGPRGLFVYRVQANGTVAHLDVALAQDDGTVAVVSQGVSAGDMVVTNGQAQLQDGTHVSLSQPQTPTPGPTPGNTG